MDWKLEVVVVPVTDVDRAKAFYTDRAGFTLDVDFSAGENFRVVQLTPPGSACSITLMHNAEYAGHMMGLQVVVNDIDEAHAGAKGRGVDVGEIHWYKDGVPTPGHHPERADFGTFFGFDDPDGNKWVVQEFGRNQ
jgi:catechol 2,3-dioxygenase-like lactoylglutathione lyase family enzyme